MNYNDVDIYACKFFTLDENKRLKFYSGVNKGKTAEDFNTLPELQKIMAYCFWILRKEDVPIVSKYLAAAFMKSLAPKFVSLERITKKKAIDHQAKMKKKTKELIKTTGKKYI
jgi:ABC-type microcin C transport system permease subunit YejB